MSRCVVSICGWNSRMSLYCSIWVRRRKWSRRISSCRFVQLSNTYRTIRSLLSPFSVIIVHIIFAEMNILVKLFFSLNIYFLFPYTFSGIWIPVRFWWLKIFIVYCFYPEDVTLFFIYLTGSLHSLVTLLYLCKYQNIIYKLYIFIYIKLQNSNLMYNFIFYFKFYLKHKTN